MRALVLACLVLSASPAVSRTLTVPLLPQSSEVALRASAFGLFSMEGRFARFAGTLTYDPAAPERCAAAIRVDVASLMMAQAAPRATILGPEFMDVAQYPILSFEGRCDASGMVDGMLTMRGESHALRLRLSREGQQIIVTGGLRRAEWGMGARPFLVGPVIHIRVSTALS